MWTARNRTEELVGRAPELEALLRATEATATRMVLLSGDAGVGKTRVLTEALERLVDAGWQPLVGHCLDFGEASMPYLPFAEMVGQMDGRGDTPPVLERMRHRPSGDAAERSERAEVFEAMAARVDELATQRQVVLVVEDTHWADASTRDLISFLLARRPPGRVLLVVTFRSDELHRRHPLRSQVAEWVRTPGVERVQLEPLPPGAVRHLVEQLLGGRASGEGYDEDLDRIVSRAQGNAFYVEELVAAFLGGGWSLPEDLADLLLVRLDRLDAPAREVVRVAAVAGQRVPHDLLERVAPVSGPELDAALRTALDAHVLVRAGDTAYAFRHALLGEAVYDDLLPGERARLHTAYAEALRELRGPSGAADLARHALASHDLPTALRASVQAGQQAVAAGGPDEAARHFARALELFGPVGTQLEDAPDETDLVVQTVDALCSAGRPETALALVDTRLARLAPDTAPTRRAKLLLARFDALRSTEFDGSPSLLTEEALELSGTEPTELRARALAMHAQALIWDDRYDEGRASADASMELSEELGLPRLAAEVGVTLTRLSQHADRGDGSREVLRRIIEDARARGDVLSELRGQVRAGGLEYDYGALAAAQQHFEAAVRLARALGRPWTNAGVNARTQAGVVAYMRGRWDEALELADHGAEDPPPTPRAMLDAVALTVAAGRGDDSALRLLPGLRARWHREGIIAVVGGGAAMELLSRREGAAAAVALHDDVCAVLVELWGEDFEALVRLAALATAALADEAPRTPTASRDEVRATAERLHAGAARVLADRAATDRPFGIEGQAWAARLDAEALRLEWLLGSRIALPALVESWRRAAGLFSELGHRHGEAQAQTRLAVALRASGEESASRQEAVAARQTAAELGAAPLLAELGAQRAATGPGILTPREREVLALVVAGRSNSDIGSQLFISGKTVSVHVSNLMAKLGAGSRTEAAALARDAGLLD